MLSLIRVAALTGILSVSVQCAVVLGERQLGEPEPVAHTCACVPFTPITSATDRYPLRTDGTWAPISPVVGSQTIGYPTKQGMVSSQPLFTHIPIGTTVGETSSVGGSHTVVKGVDEAGSTFTPGTGPVTVQLGNQIIHTGPIPSLQLTVEGDSATSTAAMAPTDATTPRDKRKP
ncbi:hypothetical protein EDD18DRAFT_1465662 [Armillaria luteobubalina]|uniref:Uncharacterized protein n=1 Tax=Armillaria luteobubalina TaxID=153913 RepID=A0AA39UJG5_9AGAR|nr:hypothetical protein EDD18DRAFT_1465662 [Armillaria luteobubalina]